MSMFLRLGNAGWYCTTKGSIFLHAYLLLCSSAFILSEKLTSERCFSTGVAGQSLFSRHVGKFSSKLISEEFVGLRI